MRPRDLGRLVGLAALAGALVAGPAPGRAEPAPPAAGADTAALRERVAAFWAARVAGDLAVQWTFFEPRVRGRLSVDEYRARPRGVRYVAYQVEEAEVRGPFATVRVRVLAEPVALAALARGRRVVPQTVVVDDPWIRIGETWYRRLEQERDPPPSPPSP
jgi:hypothetical protein